MYKVFIVDDEQLVVKSLKASVEWEKYDFTVIGEAYNGIDAFELIQEKRPDIVFTDIRMPGLNGLELIKKVKEVSKETKFIVVSAYAEFAYAQRAVNYGALGYCLKPFDDIEIINMLKKAKEELDKSAELLEREFLSIIEGNAPVDRQRVERLLGNGRNPHDENDEMLILVSVGSGKLSFSNSMNHFSLKIGRNKYVYIINRSTENDILKEYLVNGFPEEVKGIGIGQVLKDYGTIKENIEKSSIAAYQYFITGKRGVYEVREFNPGHLTELIKRLGEVINNKNIVLIHNMLDEIEKLFKEGTYNAGHAFIIYNMITSTLYRLNTEYHEGYLYSIEQLLDLFDSAGDMLAYFKSLFSKCLSENQEYPPDKIKNGMFKNILKYINENFSKDISLQGISTTFTINPSYISQLFKKEMGITFTEYLTKLRISHAGDLLKTTDLTVGEISEKAGYIDYFYFTRTFKKVVGKTPSQYRSQYVK